VVDTAPALRVCATDEDVVFDGGRAVEAVLRRGLDVGEFPVAALIRAGKLPSWSSVPVSSLAVPLM
jgi:hypothetical protein